MVHKTTFIHAFDALPGWLRNAKPAVLARCGGCHEGGARADVPVGEALAGVTGVAGIALAAADVVGEHLGNTFFGAAGCDSRGCNWIFDAEKFFPRLGESLARPPIANYVLTNIKGVSQLAYAASRLNCMFKCVHELDHITLVFVVNAKVIH